MKRKFGLPPLKASSKLSPNGTGEFDSGWQAVDSPTQAFNSGSEYISRPPPLDTRTEQDLRIACAFILKDLKPSGHDLEDTRMKTDILLEQEDQDNLMLGNILPLRGNPHSAAEWAAERNVLQRATNSGRHGMARPKDQLRVPQTILDVPQDVEDEAGAVAGVPTQMQPAQTAPTMKSAEPQLAPASSVATNLGQDGPAAPMPISARRDEPINPTTREGSSEISSAAWSTSSTNRQLSDSTGLSSAAFTPGATLNLVSDHKSGGIPAALESPTENLSHRRKTSASQAWERMKSLSSTTSLSSTAMGSNLEAQAVPIIYSRGTSMLPPPDARASDSVPRAASREDLRGEMSAFLDPSNPQRTTLRRASSQPLLLQDSGRTATGQGPSTFTSTTPRFDPSSGLSGSSTVTDSVNAHTGGNETQESDFAHPTVNPKNPRRFRENESTIPVQDLDFLDIRDKSDEPLATSRARIASRHNSRNLSMYIPDRPSSMWLEEAKPQPLNLKPKSGNSSQVGTPIQPSDEQLVSNLGPAIDFMPTSGNAVADAYGQGTSSSYPQHAQPPHPSTSPALNSHNIVVKDFWQPANDIAYSASSAHEQPSPRLNTSTISQFQHRRQNAQGENNRPVEAIRSFTPTSPSSPAFDYTLMNQQSTREQQSGRLPFQSVTTTFPNDTNIAATRSLTLSSSRPWSPAIDNWSPTIPTSSTFSPPFPSNRNSIYGVGQEYLRRSSPNLPLSAHPNFHTPRVASPSSPLALSSQLPLQQPTQPRPMTPVLQPRSSAGNLRNTGSNKPPNINTRADFSSNVSVVSYPTIIPAQPSPRLQKSFSPDTVGPPLQYQQNAPLTAPPTPRKERRGLMKLFGRKSGGAAEPFPPHHHHNRNKSSSKSWRAPKTAEQIAAEEYYDLDDDEACEAPVIRFGRGY